MLRRLGVIRGGFADGIEVIHLRKHERIDPDSIPDGKLRIITSPNFGAKWLDVYSDSEIFRIVKEILEDNQVTATSSKQRYVGGPFPVPVGVSNGKLVRSVAVWKDRGGQAHGYPCDP